MIEIKGINGTFIVYLEDIRYIQRYNDFESYVYFENGRDITIDENEYQRIKKYLLKDSDKE